jgi:hypothetical protein
MAGVDLIARFEQIPERTKVAGILEQSNHGHVRREFELAWARVVSAELSGRKRA